MCIYETDLYIAVASYMINYNKQQLVRKKTCKCHLKNVELRPRSPQWFTRRACFCLACFTTNQCRRSGAGPTGSGRDTISVDHTTQLRHGRTTHSKEAHRIFHGRCVHGDRHIDVSHKILKLSPFRRAQRRLPRA